MLDYMLWLLFLSIPRFSAQQIITMMTKDDKGDHDVEMRQTRFWLFYTTAYNVWIMLFCVCVMDRCVYVIFMRYFFTCVKKVNVHVFFHFQLSRSEKHTNSPSSSFFLTLIFHFLLSGSNLTWSKSNVVNKCVWSRYIRDMDKGWSKCKLRVSMFFIFLFHLAPFGFLSLRNIILMCWVTKMYHCLYSMIPKLVCLYAYMRNHIDLFKKRVTSD